MVLLNKKATHLRVADVQIFVAPALLPVEVLSSEVYFDDVVYLVMIWLLGMMWTAGALACVVSLSESSMGSNR